MKEGYIQKKDRKKVFLICDDIRFFSGVATIAREIVLGTVHRYNYFTVGGAMNHPDKGKRLDISSSTNEQTGLNDTDVFILPIDGYGNPDLVRAVIKNEKPDALLFITDPRYYVWLFEIEQEIRKSIPMIYLQIWDCEPAPLYNKEFYRSCDTLLAISKQTEILNKVVLGEYADEKLIKYVPHGINENVFFKITPDHPKAEELAQFKNNLLGGKDYDFVLLFNSRNIRRKSIPDLIVAFKLFLDGLDKDKADKCVLVLHTSPIDENGTDLYAVIDLFMGDKKDQIIFSKIGGDPNYMNLLYNSSDASILLSSNEGWGLSLTESLMVGKMIIANVTGGMQDQMRFEDENGDWIKFDESFCSNHFGKYKKCGKWAIPVFPSNMSIQGSVPTPYISDDRADFRDAAKAIRECYDLGREERDLRGDAGRAWVVSDESGMSARVMCKNIIEAIDETIENFEPREKYHLLKVTDRKQKTVKYPLSLV
jgi:glycosyltransferase involved in cell wall biosynthesis